MRDDDSGHADGDDDAYIVVDHSICFLMVTIVLAVLKLFEEPGYLASDWRLMEMRSLVSILLSEME